MDHYSIVDQNALAKQESDAPPPPVTASAPAITPLRFPGDDGGHSLTEMAGRDLQAALQLLAERAQYITGASGAAIALREGTTLVCRASAGSSAPALGVHLQVNSGLSGESVRTRQILRCDDSETDTRVNRESCRAMGIASVVVMPLIGEHDVNGVFELFSERAYAFEERDIQALQRIAEMIQTAVEHAEAAQRADKNFAEEKKKGQAPATPSKVETVTASPVPVESEEPVAAAAAKDSPATDEPTLPSPTGPGLLGDPVQVRKCTKCGFPVSEGRTLCLDCEKTEPTGNRSAAALPSPEALALPEETWFGSHKYLIGILLVVVILVVALLRLH